MLEIEDSDGSKDLVKDLISTGDYTFADCSDYPEIMEHHVRNMIKSGDSRGYPVVKPDDVIPKIDDQYECSERKKHKSNQDGEHKDIPLFRAVSVTKTILYMVNGGWYPVSCTPASMPNGKRWDNFASCLYHFHALYCWLEGLARTSREAREVLLYVFYGTYKWKTKMKETKVVVTRTKPFLFFLVKKMNNGRSRFVKDLEENFKMFLSYLSKHPQHKKFLDDKGSGSPPVEYLWLVEMGFRAYADNVHAMGASPLRSRRYWGEVDKWRKRECYISLVRFVLNSGQMSYRHWKNFLFTDYTLRQRSTLTFERRHLPLSNGLDEEHFKGKSFDWGKHQFIPAKRGRKAKKSTTRSSESQSTPPAASASASSQVMQYDVENDCMVPL